MTIGWYAVSPVTRARGILYSNVIPWKQNYKTVRKPRIINFIFSITYAHVRTGCPLAYKTSTQHSTWWILWRRWHKSISYNYCCTVRVPHKTLTYTAARFINCMAWWLLFSKWKWLIRRAFPLVCTLSRLRRGTRGVGRAVSGMAEVEGGVGEADTLSITLCKYIVISDCFAFSSL